jgi:Protein of unknown function (DUF551)
MKNDWISMKDRTPPIHESVLFYDAVRDWMGIGDWRQDGYFWVPGASSISSEHVTHWQPLVPPQVSDDERAELRRMAGQ